VQPQAQAPRVGHRQLRPQPLFLLLEADEALLLVQRHARRRERGDHDAARHLRLFVLADHLAPHVLQGLLHPGDVLRPAVGLHPRVLVSWQGVRLARHRVQARLPALLDVVFLHDVVWVVVEHGDDERLCFPWLARQAVQGEVELQHAPELARVGLALGASRGGGGVWGGLRWGFGLGLGFGE
jgi:hypothetical protein